MVKGDHLYVDTKWPLIKHHGIDMGDGTIIHFFRDIDQASIFDDQAPLVISRTSMADFANGRKVNIVPYRYCLPPDEVVAVAEYLLMRQLQMVCVSTILENSTVSILPLFVKLDANAVGKLRLPTIFKLLHLPCGR